MNTVTKTRISLSLEAISYILTNCPELAEHHNSDYKLLAKALLTSQSGLRHTLVAKNHVAQLTIEQKIAKGLATPEEEFAYWENHI